MKSQEQVMKKIRRKRGGIEVYRVQQQAKLSKENPMQTPPLGNPLSIHDWLQLGIAEQSPKQSGAFIASTQTLPATDHTIFHQPKQVKTISICKAVEMIER